MAAPKRTKSTNPNVVAVVVMGAPKRTKTTNPNVAVVVDVVLLLLVLLLLLLHLLFQLKGICSSVRCYLCRSSSIWCCCCCCYQKTTPAVAESPVVSVRVPVGVAVGWDNGVAQVPSRRSRESKFVLDDRLFRGGPVRTACRLITACIVVLLLL